MAKLSELVLTEPVRLPNPVLNYHEPVARRPEPQTMSNGSIAMVFKPDLALARTLERVPRTATGTDQPALREILVDLGGGRIERQMVDHEDFEDY